MDTNILKSAAESAKENFNIKDTIPYPDDVAIEDLRIFTEENTETELEKNEDGEVIIYGLDDSTNPTKIEKEDLVTFTTNNHVGITEEDLKSVMPDLDDEAFKEASKTLKVKLDQYRKDLVMNYGLTVEEADKSAKIRLKREGHEINDEYLERNPKVGIVEIDKKNVDKIEFTPEEKEKLTSAKAIRLVVVEDAELKSIKIDNVPKNRKASFIKSVEGNLSKYSVPLPIMGDFVSFKGAQTIQLVSTTRYEDDKLEDMIAKKASLIYDRMINGTIFTKYDGNNNVIMSYQDFANKFLFHDLDMAMYGILVASSMEESESTLTCSSCRKAFQQKYNLKTLLRLDDISDDYKAIIDKIIGNKANEEILSEIHDNHIKTTRYKSPFTSNIYDVSFPTVAKSIKLFNEIDQRDQTMMYLSALAIFLENIYLYNKESDSYMQINDDENALLMETLQTLPQKDIDMLFRQIRDMVYSPKFVLDSQCPHCGEKMRNDLEIDDLIFLKAQDLSEEIR